MAKSKGSEANPSKYAGRVGKVTGRRGETSVMEVPGKSGRSSSKPSTVSSGKSGSTGH